jgi:hypothetical protein
MKYETHNDRKINITGSCLQGYIASDYNKLVSLFGEPCEGDAYKIDAEWIIKFDDGSITTIYNWKNGKNYCGNEGEAVENMTEWHVGGHRKEALWMLMELLKATPEEIVKTKLQGEIKELKRERDLLRAIIKSERERLVLELKSSIKIIEE